MATFDYQAPLVIGAYADLLLRPLFKAQIDPKERTPEAILTTYNFPALAQCGLTDCHTWHKDGVLFLTRDGVEGHMGHDCAETHFPGQYTALMKDYRARRASYSHMEVIDAFMQQCEQYQTTITELWTCERGGWWADQCLRRFNALCPDFLRRHVLDMARSGAWGIYRVAETDDEDALGLGFRRGETIERTKVAELRGGNALKMSPAPTLKLLREKIAQYAATEPRQLSGPKRGQWAAWALRIPQELRDAEELIGAARLCYTRENLSGLYHLAGHENQQRTVRKMIRDIENIPTCAPRIQKAG